MRMEDFNKLVFACFGLFFTEFVAPLLIGSVLDYFLPRCHFGFWFPIMVWTETIIGIIVKKKEKERIPGPGDETPWDNDDIQDGGKI